MTALSRIGVFLLLLSTQSDFRLLPHVCGQVSTEKPLGSKIEQQPVEYQPIRPDEWKKQKLEPKLIPWEGERVVLLTTSADHDPATMTAFLQKLDAAWKVCGDVTGYSPPPTRHFKGKPIIVAIPDRGLIGGSDSIVFAGMGGGEIATFYGPDGDYERLRKTPVELPRAYYSFMAESYHSTSRACAAFSVGSRQLLVYWSANLGLRGLGLCGIYG